MKQTHVQQPAKTALPTTMVPHRPVEFEPLPDAPPDNLAIAVFGYAGSGKTRFGATAPGLGVVPLDRKTRATIDRVVKELGLPRPLMPKEDFVRHKNPMELAMLGVDEAKVYYRNHVNRVKDAVWTLAERADVRSILIDSGTQLYEDMCFAHFGRAQRIIQRDYSLPNQEFKDLLNSLADKHLVVTFEAKEQYKNDKGTGVMVPKGYNDIGYNTNVLLEFCCDPEEGFWINVRYCQDRASLQGVEGQKMLRGDMITFQMVAMQLRPESQYTEWE